MYLHRGTLSQNNRHVYPVRMESSLKNMAPEMVILLEPINAKTPLYDVSHVGELSRSTGICFDSVKCRRETYSVQTLTNFNCLTLSSDNNRSRKQEL